MFTPALSSLHLFIENNTNALTTLWRKLEKEGVSLSYAEVKLILL